MIVAPSVKAAQAPKLKKLVITAFGDRPKAASGTLVDEGGRAPVGLSVFPLDQTTRSVVIAPDERSSYALCSRGLVQFNPVTFALSRSVKPLSASRLQWCGGKLVVTGKSSQYYEYFDGGRFQVHSERPPTAPSRQVKTLEFWVIDPKTLDVDAGYLAYGDRLICAKSAPIAVGLDDDFSFDVIDIKKGNRLARYSVGDLAADLGWKPDEDPSGRPRIYDIYVSDSGDSLYLLVSRPGGTRICRFDRRGKTLKLSGESEPCQPDSYILDVRLFAAPDETFIAYRANGKIRNHDGDGFVVFPIPELGKAVGGISASKDDLQLTFDVERKLALTFGPSGKIGVVSDKNRRELTVREPGEMLPLNRIDHTQFSYVPHLKGAILLAGDISSAIQIVDDAGKNWSFAPPPALLPDLAATKIRSPTGVRPTPPLRFEVDPEIKPTVLALAEEYSSAWYQADGKAFFLWRSPYEKRVSRFNGKTGVEERRVELADLKDDAEWEMQLSANDVVLKNSDGKELITLDPQTLDAKLRFASPESLIVRTAPGSPFAVIATVSSESPDKGLRLTRLADGKTVDTLRFDDVFDLLNDQQRQEAHSVGAVRNIEMSLDGSLCFVVFNNGRLYSLFNLENGKFVHVESYTRRESAASDEGSECPSSLWAHFGWENLGTKDFKLAKTPKPFQGNIMLRYGAGPYAIDAQGRAYFPTGILLTLSPTGEEVPVPGFEGRELTTDWIAIDPTRPGRVLYSLVGGFYWIDLNQRR